MTPSLPNPILVSGYSGVGKTTLICALLTRWQQQGIAVGYCKHDGHRFVIDHEGKDTDRAYKAGAQFVTINDGEHAAQVVRLAQDSKPKLPTYHNQSLPHVADVELVVVEGHKELPLPKVLVVACDGKAPLASQWQEVFLCVGDRSERPSFVPDGIPYLHRDDIAAIAEEVLHRVQAASQLLPPVGLVLAGGQSTRMGQDKGMLDYHGKPQAEYLAEVLASSGLEDVAISANGGQYDYLPYPVHPDRVQGFGPLGGLATTMAAYPGRALFVVACDLPFVTKRSMEVLLSKRQPLKAATCFASRHNGLPEPMFAIYEPRLQPRIWDILGRVARQESKGCPRKLLLNSRIALLPSHPEVNLANANRPEDYRSISAQLAAASAWPRSADSQIYDRP